MTILCPTDFSKTSLVALEYAVKIGEKHNAHLHILYAFSDEEYNKLLNVSNVKKFDEYKNDAEAKLEAIAKQIKERKKGGKVTFSVVAGNFIQAAQEKIKEMEVSLIVLGSKGASDVMEKMAGTNTIKIIESTSIPALVVPKNANYEYIKNVVYATAYADGDVKAIQTMVDVFKPFDPSFTVLHITKDYNTESVSTLDKFRDRIEQKVQQRMNYYLKTQEGSTAIGIDEFMVENDSNVLCILMEKHDLIERIFHKSVTLQLTYLVDFPLLVLK